MNTANHDPGTPLRVRPHPQPESGAAGPWPAPGADPAEGHVDRRNTDAITGLLSRSALIAELDDRVRWSDHGRLALLFLRVDRLDLINGRLGRAVGDETLRVLAERLQAATGGSTLHARISASTFVAVRRDPGDAEAWADRCVDLVTEPVLIEDLALHISWAAALVTTGGLQHAGASLLDDAERAARQRFPVGRERIERVDLAIEAGAGPAPDIAAQLQRAVDAGEISAKYQPIIDLRTMQPVGVEALARWRDAPPGLEGPEDFLGIAGALGILPAVLDRILFEACTDFASGPAAERGWWVSVNLSKDDCVDPTLPARVGRILEETGLAPDRLILEISERAIPDPAVERSLRALARLGIRLAIDDFGSGWSSLAQLRSLPIGLIKIDRSIVANPSAADAQLTAATVTLAGALGIETLAEGVESGEDLLLLCLADCRYGQGFWWSEADTLDVILAAFPRPGAAADPCASVPAPDLADDASISRVPPTRGSSTWQP